eukprot:tig00020563_g11220.t1
MGRDCPVLQIGKLGLTDAVFEQAEGILKKNEILKVKVGGSCELTADEAGVAIAEQCGAELAQLIGATALLYRRNDDRPRILLPEGSQSVKQARQAQADAEERRRNPPRPKPSSRSGGRGAGAWR